MNFPPDHRWGMLLTLPLMQLWVKAFDNKKTANKVNLVLNKVFDDRGHTLQTYWDVDNKHALGKPFEFHAPTPEALC